MPTVTIQSARRGQSHSILSVTAETLRVALSFLVFHYGHLLGNSPVFPESRDGLAPYSPENRAAHNLHFCIFKPSALPHTHPPRR